MNEIKNTKRLDAYIEKFHIDHFFSDFQMVYPYMSLVELPRHTFFYFDDDHAHYIYFVVEGRYKVYGNKGDGKRILFRFCRAFSILGEMEFLLPDGALSGVNSVETVEPCVAVVLDFSRVKEFLCRDAAFLYFLCQVLAEKMEKFGSMQMRNSLLSAGEKVAAYLLASADHSGIFCENQRIVAEQLDISYRHLHQILRRFIEAGWLLRIKGGYRILQPDKLSEFSGSTMDGEDMMPEEKG